MGADLARIKAAEFLNVSSRSSADDWARVDKLAGMIRECVGAENSDLRKWAQLYRDEIAGTLGYLASAPAELQAPLVARLAQLNAVLH